MAKFDLIEHRDVARILEKEEKSKGYLEKYRVSVPEGSVFTSFAEMPSKEYEVYKVDLDGLEVFLVPNEMDDYYRYQPLPESVFSKRPEFLGKESPIQDAETKKENEREAQIARIKADCEDSHHKFFDIATQVNAAIPGFMDIPATFDEYKASLGSKVEQERVSYMEMSFAERSLSLIQRYPDELKSLDVTEALKGIKDPYSKVHKLSAELSAKHFEMKNGFSIKSAIIDKTMLNMKALNPNGAVIEEAKVPLFDDVAFFDGSPEKIQYLDLESEDSTYKRFGKNVEFENSLLAEVLSHFQDNMFEFSKNPDLPEFDDEGNEIFILKELESPGIYTTMNQSFGETVGKLSLVSRASMKKTVKHETPSDTPVPQ